MSNTQEMDARARAAVRAEGAVRRVRALLKAWEESPKNDDYAAELRQALEEHA